MNSYSIFPLGDSAITIDLGNCIDEQFNIKTLAIHDWLQARPFPGRLDVIAAYSSVTVFYDLAGAFSAEVGGPERVYPWLEGLLRRAWEETAFAGEGAVGAEGGWGEGAEGAWDQVDARIGGDRAGAVAGMGGDGTPSAVNMGGEVIPSAANMGGDGVRVIEIPVCYEGEYAPDLGRVAALKGLSPEKLVELHVAKAYRVYMIGFLPGFPYLGRLDDRLCVPRKPQPEAVRVGGVGIAGMQTGIYPLNSPGGWWIIGRTPAKLFDAAADPPVWLRAGDRVRFRAITAAEFKQLSIC